MWEVGEISEGSQRYKLPVLKKKRSHEDIMHDTIVNNCCCYLAANSGLILLKLHGMQLARRLCPWDFPGKNSGGGCHFLLQRNLPNPGMGSCISCIGRQVVYN